MDHLTKNLLRSERGGQTLLLVGAVAFIALALATGLMMENQNQIRQLSRAKLKDQIHTEQRLIQITLSNPEQCSAAFNGGNVDLSLMSQGDKIKPIQAFFSESGAAITELKLQALTDVAPASPDLKFGELQMTIKVAGEEVKTFVPIYLRMNADRTIFNCQLTTYSDDLAKKTMESSICDSLIGGKNAYASDFVDMPQCLGSLLKRIGSPTGGPYAGP